jgi:hypothetical protein
MLPSLSFIIKRSKKNLNKRGEASMYIRYIINSKQIDRLVNTGLRILPKYWSNKIKFIIKSQELSNAKELEAALNTILSQAQKICLNLNLENELTFERFKIEFTGGGLIDFVTFAEEQIAHRERNKLVGSGTIINDKKALKTLLSYHSKINLPDIMVEFVEGYIGFLKRKIVKSIK